MGTHDKRRATCTCRQVGNVVTPVACCTSSLHFLTQNGRDALRRVRKRRTVFCFRGGESWSFGDKGGGQASETPGTERNVDPRFVVRSRRSATLREAEKSDRSVASPMHEIQYWRFQRPLGWNGGREFAKMGLDEMRKDREMRRRDFLGGVLAAATALPHLATAQETGSQSFDRGTVTGTGLKYRFVCPALRERVHIYVIGDTHIGDDDERGKPFERYSARMAAAYSKFDRRGNLAKAVKQAAEKQVDFVALVGDIISYPSHSGVEYIRRTMDGGGVPWAYISGNHDWHYEGEEGPQTMLRARWAEKRLKPLYQDENLLMFAKVVKGLRLLFVDDSVYQILPEQLDFLKSELAKGEPTILLMHIPIYTPGRGITLGSPDWGWDVDKGWKIEGRERWPKEGCGETTKEFCRLALTAPNLLGIFTGHHHRYEMDNVHGLTQLVTPGHFAEPDAFLDLTFG